MRSFFVILSIGLTLGAPQDPSQDLPPPVVPQPRDGAPDGGPVIPEPRQSGGCDYTLAFNNVGEVARLQSQGWPSNYPAYQNCRYALTSPPGTIIQMACTEFNVESSSSCQYDAFYYSPTGDIQFRDAARTCGRGAFVQNSTTNALSIRFTSDGSNPSSNYLYRFQCDLTCMSSGAAPAPVVQTTPRPAPPPTPTNSSCSCGIRNEAPRIVGGSEAIVNEFPWRCNLYNPNMGVFCGATVISAQWVLTAAHCTNAIPAGAELYVDCADHDLQSATESTNVVVKVTKIIQHAQYNKETQDNDVSLLKLETPLTFSRTIQPACLPWNMVGQSVQGLTVTASGWGTISSGGSQSMVLKKVDLPCLDTTQCQKYYGSSVTNNMICTYAPGSDTCQGDSGGSIDYKNPTTGRYCALGVVSWGVGCAGKDQPGVYARVTNYLNWIQTQTQDNSFCKA